MLFGGEKKVQGLRNRNEYKCHLILDEDICILLHFDCVHVQVLCNQYWPPERGTGCYGALQVTTVSRHRGPDCYITTIHLRQVSHKGQRQLSKITLKVVLLC